MELYDKYATRHRVGWGIRLKTLQAQRIFQFALEHSPDGFRSVLEIGPGDGYIARLARSKDMAYLGIEGSNAVASALERQGFRIVRGRVPPLPPDVGQFESCFLLHVIEHMRDAVAAGELITSIHQHLTERGSLAIACPDYARWDQRFYDCDYTHSMPFTRRRLIQLLQDHGFMVRRMTVYCGQILGYRGLPLSWMAKLVYPKFVDNAIGPFVPKDVLNRGLLTFLPNLLAVAVKV